MSRNLFVSLAEVVATSHLLQRELHRRNYSSPPSVSVHGAQFQFHIFPVWHNYNGGELLAFAKIARQEMQHFSNSVIIDLTVPHLPLKKRLTDYFQPAKEGREPERNALFSSGV